MIYLIVGLVLFLGVHSVRIVAVGWRSVQLARMGEGKWKGIYSLVSLAGLVLLIWGFGQTRQHPVVLWTPPQWTHHVAAVLTLIAFVLIVAGNLPGTRIKRAVGHPMVLGVKVWAVAHLISNGTLADVILFGAFLVWAIVDYASSRRRDRAAGTVYPEGTAGRDALAIAIGVAAWVAFAFWLHGVLIGVQPLG
ncbi:MAG: NnrU family protein [Casimicrobiaceae bacterium]